MLIKLGDDVINADRVTTVELRAGNAYGTGGELIPDAIVVNVECDTITLDGTTDLGKAARWWFADATLRQAYGPSARNGLKDFDRPRTVDVLESWRRYAGPGAPGPAPTPSFVVAARMLGDAIDDLDNLTHDCGRAVVEGCLARNLDSLRAVRSLLRGEPAPAAEPTAFASPPGDDRRDDLPDLDF